MNQFFQIVGVLSLTFFCVMGVIATIGAFCTAMDSRRDGSDEWEESELTEATRSITVEEFCTAQPPFDSCSPPAAQSLLTRSTTKLASTKTFNSSRPGDAA